MKKVLTFLLLIVIILPLSAQGAVEKSVRASEEVEINMAVMQGPSGFGAAGLFRNQGKLNEKTKVDVTVYPSPNEVIARLANGEIDVAALPTNVAANLYAKNVGVKVAAITGEGMLMLLSTDHSIEKLEDLANRKINIPGSGSTPDQITRIMVSAFGFDPDTDVELDYSIAAPAQVAQMMIANRVDLAVMPEPFVTLILKSNPKAIPLLDMQNLWGSLTGVDNYPMTVAVISDKFIEKHPDRVTVIMDALKDSIEWVNSNPKDASVLIEEAGIMAAAMAVDSIPRCNLVFTKAEDGYIAMDTYLKVLQGFDYNSIGGSLPDESFYLSY